MRISYLSGISFGFPRLSQSYRQVPHVLLTRPPFQMSDIGNRKLDESDTTMFTFKSVLLPREVIHSDLWPLISDTCHSTCMY